MPNNYAMELDNSDWALLTPDTPFERRVYGTLGGNILGNYYNLSGMNGLLWDIMSDEPGTFSKENIIPAVGSAGGILAGMPFGIIGGAGGALVGYGVGKGVVMVMHQVEESPEPDSQPDSEP